MWWPKQRIACRDSHLSGERSGVVVEDPLVVRAQVWHPHCRRLRPWANCIGGLSHTFPCTERRAQKLVKAMSPGVTYRVGQAEPSNNTRKDIIHEQGKTQSVKPTTATQKKATKVTTHDGKAVYNPLLWRDRECRNNLLLPDATLYLFSHVMRY